MRFLLYAAAAAALAPQQQHSAALDAAERAVDAAVASTSQPIEALPPAERESVAIARRLRRRLDSFARNGDCRCVARVSKLRNSVARCGTPILMIHRNCKPVDKNLDSLNSSAAVFDAAKRLSRRRAPYFIIAAGAAGCSARTASATAVSRSMIWDPRCDGYTCTCTTRRFYWPSTRRK